jgi:hypothetical protein
MDPEVKNATLPCDIQAQDGPMQGGIECEFLITASRRIVLIQSTITTEKLPNGKPPGGILRVYFHFSDLKSVQSSVNASGTSAKTFEASGACPHTDTHISLRHRTTIHRLASLKP